MRESIHAQISDNIRHINGLHNTLSGPDYPTNNSILLLQQKVRQINPRKAERGNKNSAQTQKSEAACSQKVQVPGKQS